MGSHTAQTQYPVAGRDGVACGPGVAGVSALVLVLASAALAGCPNRSGPRPSGGDTHGSQRALLPPLEGVPRRAPAMTIAVPDHYDLGPSGGGWALLNGRRMAVPLGEGPESEWAVSDGDKWGLVPSADPVLGSAPAARVGGGDSLEAADWAYGQPGSQWRMRLSLPDGTRIEATPTGAVRGGESGGVATFRLSLVAGSSTPPGTEWTRDVDGVVAAHILDGRVSMTADGKWFALVLSDETSKWFRLAVGDVRTGEIVWTAPKVDLYAFPLTYAVGPTGQEAVAWRTPVGLHFMRGDEVVRTLFVWSFLFPASGDCIYALAPDSQPPDPRTADYLLACMTYAGDVLWVSEDRLSGTMAVSPDGRFVGALSGHTCRIYRADPAPEPGGAPDAANTSKEGTE